MHIKNINIKNVRNLKEISLDLSPGINIFYGKNAQGKTNILEAIYFVAMGRSHRTNFYKELICFGENDAFIKCHLIGDLTDKFVNIHLQKEKKGISINGITIKKMVELFGTLLVVIFSPEDLNLVNAGPGERRKFLDLNLCQLSPVYYHHLNSYYRALNQRNKLLKSIKINRNALDTIHLWDGQIIDYGTKIINYRDNYLKSLNNIAHNFHKKITGGVESLKIIYKPNTTTDYFLKRIQASLERDIVLGTTNVGIHKDDITISVNNIDVRTYGSQGQKRSSSLSLKLSGIEYIKEYGSLPVLLLDDVLSELDEIRQTFLLNEISSLQTIITCTGVEDILAKIRKNVSIAMYEVSEGAIEKK